VLVPARLRIQPQVVLQVGLDMPVPIPDLRIDDEGVYGTLSFKGVPFTCFVPWHAVFALVGDDAKGMVWSSEMPFEIASEVDRQGHRRRASGGTERWGDAPGADLVRLDDFRSNRSQRPSQVVPRRKSERPPAFDRPSYLRVVK
jgi:stringent starvation protein B